VGKDGGVALRLRMRDGCRYMPRGYDFLVEDTEYTGYNLVELAVTSFPSKAAIIISLDINHAGIAQILMEEVCDAANELRLQRLVVTGEKWKRHR
jgi:hypothetical protein